jgi:hypothetical protein
MRIPFDFHCVLKHFRTLAPESGMRRQLAFFMPVSPLESMSILRTCQLTHQIQSDAHPRQEILCQSTCMLMLTCRHTLLASNVLLSRAFMYARTEASLIYY